MVQRKKQVRNRIWLCMAVFCMLGTNKAVIAAEENHSLPEMTQVTIEEADMKMQMPTACYLLRQNIAEDDPYLQKVGADRETIENYYKEAGIFLDAIAKDDSYEIVVTVNESSNVDYVYNLQSLTQEQTEQLAETIRTTYVSYGYEVNGYELYQTADASYVLFDFVRLYGEQKVHCKQFYTIRNSKIYNITLRSYTGEITKEMDAMFRQVADSTVYTGEQNIAMYENKDYGVSFSLAEGWERVVDKRDNPYLRAQYVHCGEVGESMQFFCMDIWENMDSLHRLFNSRENLTMHENMTNSDKKNFKSYASGFFSDYGEVTFEQVGDNWYLTSKLPKPVTNENTADSYLQKTAVCIQNGILYAFQYGYYENANLHEADFEEWLNNVSYESPQILQGDSKYYEDMTGMRVKLVLLAVSIIAVLAGVMYLYHKGTGEKK